VKTSYSLVYIAKEWLLTTRSIAQVFRESTISNTFKDDGKPSYSLSLSLSISLSTVEMNRAEDSEGTLDLLKNYR
jgi:hypothetical protein